MANRAQPALSQMRRALVREDDPEMLGERSRRLESSRPPLAGWVKHELAW